MLSAILLEWKFADIIILPDLLNFEHWLQLSLRWLLRVVVKCRVLLTVSVSANFHSKSIADNTIDIALTNYRRYHDRYQKSISDITDIDTFIAILTTLDIAVEISLLSWLKAEIYVISYLLPFLSRHICYLVGATLVLIPPSCSPAIFGKSHYSVSVNS